MWLFHSKISKAVLDSTSLNWSKRLLPTMKLSVGPKLGESELLSTKGEQEI